MPSGCAVSVAGGSKWLLQFKHQDAREGLAISRLPPLRLSTSLPPFLLRRLARTPDRCRLFTVAAQDSNPRQQQQELDVSVLRFTFEDRGSRDLPGRLLDRPPLSWKIGAKIPDIYAISRTFLEVGKAFEAILLLLLTMLIEAKIPDIYAVSQLDF
ncbi:hypothetical protein GW17_00056870 [Ensete ventricosum]|nr:hypothetical protein GW17_00056870 [Ensete ventricosum]